VIQPSVVRNPCVQESPLTCVTTTSPHPYEGVVVEAAATQAHPQETPTQIVPVVSTVRPSCSGAKGLPERRAAQQPTHSLDGLALVVASTLPWKANPFNQPLGKPSRVIAISVWTDTGGQQRPRTAAIAISAVVSATEAAPVEVATACETTVETAMGAVEAAMAAAVTAHGCTSRRRRSSA